MRPKLNMLDEKAVAKIIEEGFALLMDPGIEVNNDDALHLLREAGADVNMKTKVARIPEALARQALETAPSEFYLYNLDGEPAVHYGGDSVHFDPGSAALMLLDSETQKQREPNTADFVKFVKLVETLPEIDAQSTAMIPTDVTEEIGDLYRLYLALNYMRKPIVTGAFRTDTWWTMKDMLVAVAGSAEALAEKPIAIFDVCPSPPLKWSNLTCQNMVDCARHSIPSEIVSMPLTGATAPVTLAGAVVQHTAECLSGVTISQLAKEGAPIVWGGSPAALDMRESTTPMGAVGTWMIDCAYTQIGKALNMPTHAYLGMTDAKVVDAQCGMESSGGTLMAALAGVNMVSGAGMMAFENCQSYEKLVIDAEIIGMAKRLIAGIQLREDPIALPLIRELGHNGTYITHDHTYQWFRKELHIPSRVIDRQPPELWEKSGSLTAWDRAKLLVNDLLETYQPNNLSDEVRAELREIATKAARKFGMDELPLLPEARD
ncbi:MAG: trimethylamine methyltransferase family protein [Chloroflexota bacterium]|nr:trimethylamine methyltransferase family protein [Chloroflexota bacterium]